MRFDDQVAVITGAGGGLGKEYALLLASRGARVVVNDTGGSVTGAGSDADAATAVAEEIRQHGGQAIADTHSVTSPEGGQAIIDAALRTWGRIDIVINNAGIVLDAPFEEMTADQFDPLLDVHLKGAFYVTRPAWKAMRLETTRSFGQQIEEWRRVLEKLAARYGAGDASVDPKPDACDLCGLRALCRIREFEHDRG